MLWRHRLYAIVDIAGLAFGMSACLLILLLIRDQQHIDRFHEDPGSIHLVTMPQHRTGGLVHDGSLSVGYGPAIADEVPGIEAVTRLVPMRARFMHRNMPFDLEGLFAEPSFFDVFGFETESGRTDGLLDRPGTVVLSDRTARRLFGHDEPVGEVLTTADDTYLVTGVVQTSGVRSHLDFDALFSFSSYENQLTEQSRVFNTATYVRLSSGTRAKAVEQVLPALSESMFGHRIPEFRLISITDFALGPAIRSSVASASVPWIAVAILGLLALSILLAAVLNYAAIATARYLGRAREYGIRKVVGAGRRHIVQQFVLDGVLTTLLALMAGRWLLGVLVSGFNRLSLAQQLNVQIDPATLSDTFLLGMFVLFSLGVGAVSGLIPALRVSRLQPARILRGGILHDRGAGRSRTRRILTVGQMTFALVLMVSTMAAYRQTGFMLSFDYGFSTNEILHVDLKGNVPDAVLDRLEQHAAVEGAVALSNAPGLGRYDRSYLVTDGDSVAVALFHAGPGFTDLLDIDVLAGSDFSPASVGEILINEAAVHSLGYFSVDQAVERTVEAAFIDQPLRIAGVLENIQFDRLDQEVQPMVVMRDADAYHAVLVKAGAGAMPSVLHYVESFWADIDPIHPPDVRPYEVMLDESGFVKRLQDFVRLVGLMAVLSLVITCLGLMSMAAFRARMRRKEVGIRKALGASIRSVVWLLSREVLVLMIVAAIIATPLAWIVNRWWLQFFAHRIEFGPQLILLSAGIVVLASLAAVTSQTIRAAVLNPIDVIRDE